MTSFKIVIPARYASTRLPGKPLIMLNGKSMIEHVYHRAIQSGANDVVIATDDQRIVDAASAFGADVETTSAEHQSGSDRVAEVIAKRGWSDDEVVVNLQGDEPLTPPAILQQVASNLHHHGDAQIATLCSQIHDAGQAQDPHAVKVVRDINNFALYFSRAPIPWERDSMSAESEDAPRYFRHVGIYAYRAGFLKEYTKTPPCLIEQMEKLEQLRALYHGAKIHVDVAQEPMGHGIDVPDDVPIVEALLKQQA